MKKNKFNFSDFSKKELENLKEYYVNEKVKSMNEFELRKFVYDSVRNQIQNTIGVEEEQEAWDEIKNFFSENFEDILEGIKKKFEAANQDWKIKSKQNSPTIKIKEKDDVNNKKIDMWMD